MIAVCLLVADRFDYTRATLESFAAHNDRSRFRLFYADDASSDARVPALAKAHGFTKLARSKNRQGWRVMRPLLFERAASLGADWILYLENDCEWLRPFPWDLFRFIQARSEFYCLRLHGAFKDRHGADPCMIHHKLGDRTRPVKWQPLRQAPEPAEVGFIHWSAQPSVTRAAELIELHRQPKRQAAALTARVVQNVTAHIGVERTAMPIGVSA